MTVKESKSTSHKTANLEASKKLGQTIKTYRLVRNMTQSELASKAGIHRTYLIGVEQGTRGFTLRVLCSLAIALGTKPSKLARAAEKF